MKKLPSGAPLTSGEKLTVVKASSENEKGEEKAQAPEPPIFVPGSSFSSLTYFLPGAMWALSSCMLLRVTVSGKH